MHVCLVLTFRAGKLARCEVFETVAEAVEAVGPAGVGLEVSLGDLSCDDPAVTVGRL